MKKKVYSLEFKQEAVRLSEELGSAGEAASHLGLKAHTIHNWKHRGIGKSVTAISNIELEVKKLRKENSELKKVNYILKKAAAFFSQDHIK